MYLEEENNEKSEVISCIFSLKEEVGALARGLRLFEVNLLTAQPITVDQEASCFPLTLLSHLATHDNKHKRKPGLNWPQALNCSETPEHAGTVITTGVVKSSLLGVKLTAP